MTVYIALLRAINVSGTGTLPMKQLKSACETAGLRRVSTYIASGNLVFDSADTAAAVKSLIAGLLRDQFGLAGNHVMIRTPDALARVIAGNPFAEAAIERPNHLLVNFLDGRPHADAAATLAGYAGPERLHLDGDHLYIDYVLGVARPKLPPTFLAKALQVPATARNWNTTGKLLDMARALSV
jgi:uncharacterized protein (DUF1697 family)